MNIFSIDFFEKSISLVKEAFKFKKYKLMDKWATVLLIIFMLPLIVSSVFLAGTLIISAFFVKIIQTPVNYLKSLVNSEGKEVKHATQFIIYFISWPLVFVLYVVSSFLLIYEYILYAVLACICYAWSLGGFKFHVFVDTYDDISIEVAGKYNIIPLIVYCSIAGLLTIIIPLILNISDYIRLWNLYLEEHFRVSHFVEWMGVNSIFSLLYSYILLCNRPKQISE